MLIALLLAGSLAQAAQAPIPPPSAPLPSSVVQAEPRFSAPLGLVITGAPGSGKGTQGARLAAEFGLVHISAGQLLREHAAGNPDVAETMRRGELVPTGLVVSLVRQRLTQPDIRAQGFVLDGFPRRLEEVTHLDAMRGEGLPVDAVIRLEVVESELLRRVLSRGRADDSRQIFEERMRVYRDQTQPAIAALAAGAPTATIDVSAPDIDQNYARVREALLAISPRAAPLRK